MNTLRIPTVGTMMLRNNNGTVNTLVLLPEPYHSLLHSTDWAPEEGFEPITLESIELPGNGRIGCLAYRYNNYAYLGTSCKFFHEIEVLTGIEWPPKGE